MLFVCWCFYCLQKLFQMCNHLSIHSWSPMWMLLLAESGLVESISRLLEDPQCKCFFSKPKGYIVFVNYNICPTFN